MDSIVIFRGNKTTEVVITPKGHEEIKILDLIPDQEENRSVTIMKRCRNPYGYTSESELQDVLITITDDTPPQWAVIRRLKTLLRAVGVSDEMIKHYSDFDQTPNEINSFSTQFTASLISKLPKKARRTEP